VVGRYGPLLDALHGVRWPAQRPGSTGVPGAHRARQRGPAGDFTEVRPYRQGDDPRQLDWRLLARSDRAYVRLKDDRIVRPTWLVLDASASMAYPSAEAADGKWGMARALAVGLAWVALAGGDPVGVVAGHAAGVLRLPPRARRGLVEEIATRLEALRCGGSTPLGPALAALPAGARVVVCADGLGDAADQRRAAGALVAGGAEVTCVHLVAPGELDAPDRAETARDPEGVRPDQLRDAAGWAAFRARFDAFRVAEGAAWRQVGARWLEVRTDAPPAQVVRRVVLGASAA
jgi:uncharacterized protein (DUF58 family)